VQKLLVRSMVIIRIGVPRVRWPSRRARLGCIADPITAEILTIASVAVDAGTAFVDQLVLVESALARLAAPAVLVGEVDMRVCRMPGLYALHASAATWRQLGLGAPPDLRPLYVGKAEHTLASRDLDGHFGMRPGGRQSPTGSSTVRRSLAALRAPAESYRGIPRNPDRPGHFANYGLSAEHDKVLSAWMRRRLRLTMWPHENAAILNAIETGVLTELLPPLNIEKVATPWRKQVKTARSLLAEQARQWTRSDESIC
jgi:hypothetical protein